MYAIRTSPDDDDLSGFLTNFIGAAFGAKRQVLVPRLEDQCDHLLQ